MGYTIDSSKKSGAVHEPTISFTFMNSPSEQLPAKPPVQPPASRRTSHIVWLVINFKPWTHDSPSTLNCTSAVEQIETAGRQRDLSIQGRNLQLQLIVGTLESGTSNSANPNSRTVLYTESTWRPAPVKHRLFRNNVRIYSGNQRDQYIQRFKWVPVRA